MTLALRARVASPTRDAACAALLARLGDEGIEQVRIAWADLHGTYRGKTLVGRRALAGALADGVGMVSTVLLKDTSDRTALPVFEPGAPAALPGFGAANNLLLLPDPATFQRLPWAPDTGWLRADPFHDDGSALEVDPRRVLQRALAALADAGFTLRCGLEVEFHAWRIVDAKLAVDDAAWPAEPPSLELLHPGYALLAESAADLAHDALGIVRRTALALGLPLRSLEIELGPSQFEAVFDATDALTTADQMLVLRNHVRQALRRAGYHASFVCKPPLPGAVASGWHLHQSLVDGEGRNAMAGGLGESGDRHALSPAGRAWLGGLLAHARALAAPCAPTLPAYTRFRGSLMAPQAAVWGRDNRGAMLRVVGQGDDARIENRIGEPLANPYLAIAAQVFAGLDGLARGLDPGPAVESPYAGGLPQLPASLAEALDALAVSPVLQRGFGPAMAHLFHVVKQHEIARHAEADDAAQWERREYLGRY